LARAGGRQPGVLSPDDRGGARQAARVRRGRARRARARPGVGRGAVPLTEGDGSSAGRGPRATLARGNPCGMTEGDRSGAADGAIAWFTGLPSSGKTRLARRAQARLAAAGRVAIVLDSDELRDALDAHSYNPGDRDRFYRAVAALAALLAR